MRREEKYGIYREREGRKMYIIHIVFIICSSTHAQIFGKEEARKQALELILAEVSFAKSEDGTVLKEDTKKETGARCSSAAIRISSAVF